MKPSAIIERLGGASAVARALGLPVNTVSNWKTRESIPGRYWVRLMQLATAQRTALTAEEIAEAHAGASPQASAA